MLNFIKNNKHLILIILITISVICLTLNNNISLIIDCGREAYYPQQILDGEVLYKNLFCIYGPFAYLFNAFLYKIFGINLNTLCIAGSICALGIIITVFLITKKLFNDIIAFNITLLSVSTGVATARIFNYVFPYSFSMTYGLLSFLISVLFLINFISSQKYCHLYLSLFFAGIAITSKYEFLPYLIIYFILFYKLKPKFIRILKSIASLSLVPILCFGFLFLQGLTLFDIQNTINIVISMTQTQTLKYFYMHSGILPHKESVLASLVTAIFLFIPIFIYSFPKISKNKFDNRPVSFISILLSVLFILIFKLYKMYDIFMALPIILIICAIINYKKIINNQILFIVIFSAILYSLKIFWGLILNSYGVYYLPLVLISICAIFKDKFEEKDWNYISFFAFLLAVLIGFNNIKSFADNRICISTQKGKIYTEKKYEKTKELLDYINKNTQRTDKIVIFPEGMMINFLSDRKTDGFYNSMLPLYEETFGINAFKEHFSKSMPEYIIFNSWNTSDYYFSIICKDYGFNFCDFVTKNYRQKIKLSGEFNYVVFEKK